MSTQGKATAIGTVLEEHPTSCLTLAPEAERELRERAAASGRGQSVESFIRRLVEREVTSSGGAPPARMPPSSGAGHEMLDPVRREFEESGMSEEDLTRFLTEVRNWGAAGATMIPTWRRFASFA